MNPWFAGPMFDLTPANVAVGFVSVAWVTVDESRRNHLARLGFDDYDRYLATFHWRWARWKTRVRCGWRCSVCGARARDAALIAHHNNYALGRETRKDFTLLCAYHHNLVHRNAHAPVHPRTAARRSAAAQAARSRTFTVGAGPAGRVAGPGGPPPPFLPAGGARGVAAGGLFGGWRRGRGEAPPSGRRRGGGGRTDGPGCAPAV